MQLRPDQMLQAASMYYVQGETMDSIARQLKVSRSTVSRMLKQARESGLVRITLATTVAPRSRLEEELAAQFGVQVHTVQVRDGSPEVHRLERVARAAAQLLGEAVRDDMVLGAAWGTTLAAVVRHLRPHDLRGTTVVQMNGAANATTSGLGHIGLTAQQLAQAFDADFVAFPVPAFFDYAETRQAMWRERSVQHVRALQHRIDLAVFGVGGFAAQVPSHVYSAGYLDPEDLDGLRRQGAVGDVNTVFLREDGSWRDITLNSRASGMTPEEVVRIPRRVCVVAGQAKAAAVLGALRAGVCTDLVLDEDTARAVLARARDPRHRVAGTAPKG